MRLTIEYLPRETFTIAPIDFDACLFSHELETRF